VIDGSGARCHGQKAEPCAEGCVDAYTTNISSSRDYIHLENRPFQALEKGFNFFIDTICYPYLLVHII
jgi:hypothetical protein